MTCPKCSFEADDGAAECPRCGVVFARLASARPAPPTTEGPALRELDRDGLKALGVGLAIAIPVFLVPFLNFVFAYLVVLIHEFGHAVAGWIFGYPSLPAFDFSYGGGATLHGERQVGLVVLVYLAAVGAGWLLRRSRLAVASLAAVVAIYSVLAWTPAHEALMLFMGHGAELLFAGLFLYRAMSGSGVRVPAERPAYAFAGWFILLFDLRFALRLFARPAERALYEDAKGGGHWMDFSRLADEYLHTSLDGVAFLFLLLCLLVPLLAFLAHRGWPRLVAGAVRASQSA
jgi:hypothetical protein